MRIDHLELINFKNFEQLSVNFHPGVNLFVGTNGSGKTSILEAINVAVGGFFASQEGKLQRPILFDEIKITNGKREPVATVKAKSFDLNIEWSRSIKRDTKNNDAKGTNAIARYGEHIFTSFDLPKVIEVAPLIAFYSTQRLFKDASLSGKQKYDPAAGRRNGYLQCLKETAIKGVLEDWLKNAVVRRTSKQANDISDIDIILQNVESAVKQTLIYGLDVPNDIDLRIYPDPDFDYELFVRYDEDHNFPLKYYSDGFRNLVYLIIDMVWRASQLNPWMSLKDLQDISGVVTIDEIDLHLHPRWQMKAIDMLINLFPAVQFFITTHSPTVVANMQKGTLFVISNNQISEHQSDFFGKQVDDVLRDILGSPDRNVLIQQKLNRLFRLIDRNDKEHYTTLLNQLTDQLGTEDLEIQKALALIAMSDYQNEH